MVKYIKENHEDIIEIPIEYIKDATLLSKEEYERYKNNIPKIKSRWWLRSTKENSWFANIVNSTLNAIYALDVSNKADVRPALILNTQSSDFNIGDEFNFGGYIFTVISDDLAICNTIVDNRCFNEKSLEGITYENSDMKKFIEDWFYGIKYNAKDEFDKDDWGF